MNRVLSVCVMGGAVSVIALQEYKADLCIVKEGRQTYTIHTFWRGSAILNI